VVVCVGETVCDPLGSTLLPSRATSVAFSVLHVNVADWPASMEVGLAESVALTALGGGGGGGAGCFFLHPLATIKKASTPRTTIRLLLLLFTSCPPKNNAIFYNAYLKLQLGWLLRP
jgi:hypothetical protein